MTVVEPPPQPVRTACPYCGVGCGVLATPDGKGGAVIAGDPAAYQADPNMLDFYKGLPTTWDETRVLQAEFGKLLVLARRKGRSWYLAAMSAASEPMTPRRPITRSASPPAVGAGAPARLRAAPGHPPRHAPPASAHETNVHETKSPARIDRRSITATL